MPRPGAPKHPPTHALLGFVLLVCAFAIVACGKSSPSSSTSAGVTATSEAAGGTSTTGATGTASTGGGSSSAGAGGSTSATGASGSTGATGAAQPAHGHVKRATKGSGSVRRLPGRLKGSILRRCLEQNGIKPHANGSKGSTRGQLQAALKRCDPQLVRRPAVKTSPTARHKLLARPAYRRALARFTACMRQHGLPNFPEANTSGSGPLYPAGVVKPTPQERAAQRACIGQLAVH